MPVTSLHTATSHDYKPSNLAAVGRFLEALEKQTDEAGLVAKQIQILLVLYTAGETSQSNLMRVIGTKAKTTHSRHITKLSVGDKPLLRNGPGWVENYDDPVDRRTKLVRLTPRGRALLDRVIEATF